MNLFFLPLICPSCRKKIFFCRDKKDKKIYTVTDQIESLIEPHICSLIEGEKYWKDSIFKEYLKIDFTPQDDIFLLVKKKIASDIRLDTSLQKKVLFINLGLLLRCESVANYGQCLYLLTKDFILCKVFIKSTKKWELGRWLSIYNSTMEKKNQFRSLKIQYFEVAAQKTLVRVTKHISVIQLSSKDGELLETQEKKICSALKKIGRVIAVFPVEKEKLCCFRRIFFFPEKNMGDFIANLILPQKIEIYCQQEKLPFIWNIYENSVVLSAQS